MMFVPHRKHKAPLLVTGIALLFICRWCSYLTGNTSLHCLLQGQLYFFICRWCSYVTGNTYGVPLPVTEIALLFTFTGCMVQTLSWNLVSFWRGLHIATEVAERTALASFLVLRTWVAFPGEILQRYLLRKQSPLDLFCYYRDTKTVTVKKGRDETTANIAHVCKKWRHIFAL
jgi:hypothetical protein